MSAADLQKHDIVITTYQTVAGEYEETAVGKTKKKKSDRTLFEVAWKVHKSSVPQFFSNLFQRVILDEGHNIRNPKTKMAKSVVNLQASRRWVLSGTPIVSIYFPS
jgi:SWI/SNF-related matrix-associated actin-dependent regulator of chromatin subfamily A3